MSVGLGRRAVAAAFVLFATAAVGAFACNLTDGLTGGPVPCDANVTSSPFNCGVCGNACAFGANSIPVCADSGCGLVCAAGFGDCDHEAGNGCETNLALDPVSCGRCGHDCLGGTCLGGACQPVTLLSGPNAPAHIAIDAQYVYGVNGDGTVTRIPKDGGAAATLVSGTSRGQQYPYPRIAVDGTNIYWSLFSVDDTYLDAGGDAPTGDSGVKDAAGDGAARDAAADASTDAAGDAFPGAILAVPIDGGSPRAITIGDSPYAVFVRGGALYWSEGNPYEGDLAVVKRCLLNASACVGSELAPVPSGRVNDVIADLTNVYVSNSGMSPGNVGAISRCPIANAAGCGPLVDNLFDAYGLAVDTGNVYWSTSNGNIDACPIVGCSDKAITLDLAQDSPKFPATDGLAVFFPTADGAIKSVPIGGGSERTLFQLRGSSPWSLAVDATAVYWTDTASTASLGLPGPALRRIAK
jgi:hypothetical protein